MKYRFPDAVMHPINYGDTFPWSEIQPEDTVYMVDFCLQPFNNMRKLAGMLNRGNLIWLDHHSEAIKEWQNKTKPEDYEPWFIARVRTDWAACELTWEYLFPDRPVPLAVKLLSLYDSWTYQGHELEDMVLPFQMRMRMEDLDPKDWDNVQWKWINLLELHHKYPDHDLLHQWCFETFDQLVEEGRLLLRYDEQQKRRYAETYAFETVLRVTNGYTDSDSLFPNTPIGDSLSAIAVNLGHTNSKVFDSVWRRECKWCRGKGYQVHKWENREATCQECNGTGHIEPYDLMITFVRRTDRRWNVSLYSTKSNVDCGAIAKSFGGGGHRGAAGFQCDALPFDH